MAEASGTGVKSRLQDFGNGIVDRIARNQDRIVDRLFDRWAITYTYTAFAFVFFYFGIQKPAPVDTPVRTPVAVFVHDLSVRLSRLPLVDVQIAPDTALIFIGAYEMFMGLLFLFQLIRIVFWFFLIHQAVGFLSLILTWDTVFQPPWLSVFGMDVPWALGAYSAFVLKNLVFIGAFMFLASRELGSTRGQSESSRVPSDQVPGENHSGTGEEPAVEN